MDKRDMILRALVKYEGKWPSRQHFDNENGYVKSENEAILVVHAKCPKYPNEDVGDIITGGTRANPDCYNIITRPEFEKVMQDLADKAPEGATHYLPNTHNYQAKRGYVYHPVNYYGVDLRIQLDESFFDDLIPLPKRQPAPWVPQVGKEYKVIEDGNLMYGAGESGECIGHIENCAIIRMSYGLGCFEYKFLNPILTEFEIERERLCDQLSNLDVDLNEYQIQCIAGFIQGREKG